MIRGTLIAFLVTAAAPVWAECQLLGTGSPYSTFSQDIAASLDVTSDSPGTQPAGLITGIHGQPVQIGGISREPRALRRRCSMWT